MKVVVPVVVAIEVEVGVWLEELPIVVFPGEISREVLIPLK